MKAIIAGLGLIGLVSGQATDEPTTVPTVVPTSMPTMYPTSDPTPKPSVTAGNSMVATFSGDNNITGTVTVDNGYVIIDIDGSLMPDINGDDWSTCVSGGMKYHIHMLWEHDDDTDQINSTMCGADYTGGHWDPWQGCGSATGNSYCSAKGGCIDDSYSASFSSDVFSAEVGDWNGKYGLLVFDSNGSATANDSSYFEVTPEDVEGMSVVFHCNGGSRAFCAPFVDSGEATNQEVPEQDSTSEIVAVFDTLSDGSHVYFSSEMTSVYLDMTDVDDNTGCSEWSYGLFYMNMSNTMNITTTSLVGDDCSNVTGDFYDPTHQCMDFSGSEFCNGSLLCGDGGYSYDCDFENDRYSCAPGDLSGKMGTITDLTTPFYYASNDTDLLLPPLSNMSGMVFAVYCGDNDSGLKPLTCAPLFDINMTMMNMTNTTTTTTSTPTASGNSMVATFSGDNDITGTVTVDNGYVIIDMDGSLMPEINGANWSECVSGGMKYHIHMLWEHSNDTDQFGGTMCGADYTGGHWDPWQGCGSATGNSYCSAKGGCVDDTYSASFSSDVFSAEVGDWNGKYGLLEFSDSGYATANASSYFEVTPEDVEGMSVVFHCNGGDRAFCAPFVDSGEATKYTIPNQDVSNSSVMAELVEDGYVYMSADGEVTTDHKSIDLSDDAGDCDELYYGIFEVGEATLDGYATGEDCESYVGDFWDPTHQCPDFSGSEFCNGTLLCGDDAYSYDCDYENDRYSCAPGDFSGKFGSITDASSFEIDEHGPDTLIPTTDDMVGMMFVVYCGDNTEGITYVTCATVTEVPTTAEDPESGDDAMTKTVGVTLVATLIAMLF